MWYESYIEFVSLAASGSSQNGGPTMGALLPGTGALIASESPRVAGLAARTAAHFGLKPSERPRTFQLHASSAARRQSWRWGCRLRWSSPPILSMTLAASSPAGDAPYPFCLE